MKYPKDSYIVNGENKKKVLEVLGDLRFLSHESSYENWETKADPDPFHIAELERDGWKVEEEKWKPEVGEKFYFVDGCGDIEWEIYAEDSLLTKALYELGNCFPSADCPEILEAQRKIKDVFKK